MSEIFGDNKSVNDNKSFGESEPLSDDDTENLDRFIVEAIASGCVWSLQAGEGWALCGSEKYEKTDVMPFWSQEAFAKVHCKDDWKGYQPLAIELGEFLEDWLTGMHADVILVGINWDESLDGVEIEPLDLLEEFDQELADD
jgi:hypothetical protein